MNKRNTLIYVFSIIPITIVCNMQIVINENIKQLTPLEVVINSLFSSVSINNITVYAIVIEKLYYIIFFSLFFGTFIYKDFIIAKDYIFTRLSNRKKWFYKKSLKLFLFASVYTFCLLLTLLLISIVSVNKGIHLVDLKPIAILWMNITILLTCISIIQNVLSIKYNSSMGFIIMLIIFSFLIILAIKNIPSILRYPFILLINPMVSVILNMTGLIQMQIISSIYIILLVITVCLLGAGYIDRLEIGIIKDENY